MKRPTARALFLAVASAMSLLPVSAAFAEGEDTNAPPAEAAPAPAVVQAPAPAPAPAPSAVQAAPARLPYGVDDVLKLTKAQVGEDLVINFVLNSGTVYNLRANDIVYLRNQGVSERVLTTMMNQRNHVGEEAAAQAAAAQEAAAQAYPAPAYPAPAAPAPAPQYAPVYPKPPPAPQPSSSLYVIPSPPPINPYYGYYAPYSYGYYGPYFSPGISIGFGFGRGGYWGGRGFGGGYYRYGRGFRR